MFGSVATRAGSGAPPARAQSPHEVRSGEDALDLCLRFAAGRGARLFDSSANCFHSAPMELGAGLRWGVVDDEIGSADAARVAGGGGDDAGGAEEAAGRRAAWRDHVYATAAAQLGMSALVGEEGRARETAAAAAARADATRDATAAAAAAEEQRRAAQGRAGQGRAALLYSALLCSALLSQSVSW